MAKILLSGHGTSRAAAALNTNTLHGLLKSHCLMYGLHTSHYGWMYAMEFGAKTYDPVRHAYLCFPRIHNADVVWIWTACQYMIFIDLHILTYMAGLICSESIAYRCGNTFLTYTRLRSLLMPLRGNTYVFTCSGRAKSRNTCMFPCFLLQTTGNTCAFHANLLSSSLKQQETPGFEVLQRRSLCYHISAAAMLPEKLCSTWAEKLSCHKKKKTSVSRPKNSYRC